MLAPAEIHARLAEIVSHTGPFAPAVLFLASFVEHVFPPFPGDLLVLLGAWYAVQGELSWPMTFLSVTSGAVLGAGVDWGVGSWVGRRLEDRAERRAALGGRLTPEKLAAFEARYRRWGPLLLLANRFFPGFRAFFFVAAGAARVPLGEVLLFGGLSAALWNAGLLAAGAFLAHNVDELIALLQQYTRAVTTLLVVALLLYVARKGVLAVLRRRRA